jgi:hypothetical protein
VRALWPVTHSLVSVLSRMSPRLPRGLRQLSIRLEIISYSD